MFIQVIQGKVADRERLEACMTRWQTDLLPGAIGYIGTTAGTSDDGTFIALARFDSEESARRNSERPEQGAWWAEMAQCFDGEPTFMNCGEVFQWLGGGSDDAHFVQIMEGRTPDPERLREIWTLAGDRLHEMRPEILGGTFMRYGDGKDYVEAVYFTSEEEARRGEKLEVPDDLRSLLEEDQQLSGDVRYFDLHEPVLVSAPRT